MKRSDFPLLNGTIYLDSAAGALKPLQVIEAMNEVYAKYPINSHSADSKLGSIVIQKINEAREEVASLVDATPEEVIFTSGTTESLNAFGLMSRQFIKKGDKIVISLYCHASAVTPFVQTANLVGAEVELVEDILGSIDNRTKMVVFAQQNNSIAQENDIEKIYAKVKENGAILVNDAAQAIMHGKVSLDNCDVIAFSGNKLYGPFGTGALVINEQLLKLLKPVKYGGGALIDFDAKELKFKDGVHAHEAGTLNVAGIIGLGAAVKYFKENLDVKLEHELALFAYDELIKLDNVDMISKRGDMNILFRVKGVASQDVVSTLGHQNIILRSGKQCALYLFKHMCITDVIRMSFASYNTKEDIQTAVNAIKGGGDFVTIF